MQRKRRQRQAVPRDSDSKYLPKFLKVAPSTIPKAGKGLFAISKVKKGTRLGEYKGERLLWHIANAEGRDSSYFMHVNDQSVERQRPEEIVIIDGSALDNPMRWPNHGGEAGANAQAEVEDSGRVFFRTTREVAPGAEIFIDYGEDYWNT